MTSQMFFIGKPCKHGHGGKRYLSSKSCVQCTKENEKRDRKKPARRDRSRRRTAKKGGYAPPPSEKDCPPIPTNGICECCFRFTDKLCLDHDHVTGSFRGWICRLCNRQADCIERLVDYIELLKLKVILLENYKKRASQPSF